MSSLMTTSVCPGGVLEPYSMVLDKGGMGCLNHIALYWIKKKSHNLFYQKHSGLRHKGFNDSTFYHSDNFFSEVPKE